MQRQAHIYLLIDPRTAEVRYVGWTFRRINDRLTSHCYEAKIGGKTHKSRWIRQLQEIGLRPTAYLIEITADYATREMYWIAHYRSAGCNLINETPGGNGGVPWSEEARAKHMAMWTPEMRDRYRKGAGHLQSPEIIKLQSEARRGKKYGPQTEEHKAKISAAVSAARKGLKRAPFSEEWKAKLGAAHKGKPKSAKVRAIMAEHHRSRSKITAEQANDIRCLANLLSGPVVARMYGISHNRVYAIWWGRSDL